MRRDPRWFDGKETAYAADVRRRRGGRIHGRGVGSVAGRRGDGLTRAGRPGAARRAPGSLGVRRDPCGHRQDLRALESPGFARLRGRRLPSRRRSSTRTATGWRTSSTASASVPTPSSSRGPSPSSSPRRPSSCCRSTASCRSTTRCGSTCPSCRTSARPILIRHLLTHTSGLGASGRCSRWRAGRPREAVHTVDEILELVSGYKELNFKPGDEYLYNNTAFTLLSVVVQRVSGNVVRRLLPGAPLQAARDDAAPGGVRTSRRSSTTAPPPTAGFPAASSARTCRSPTSSATAASSPPWATS